MFNYWNECKRSNISDNAELLKLCIDYDDGARKSDVQEAFKDYDYIIYNSTGNMASQGIEKFRLILTLKEPIKAVDLEHWRNSNKFKEMFNGCDYSSFAKGRFFYRPSKFDKDGEPVKVQHHSGKSFDFYSMFKHYVKNETFEKLCNKIRFGEMKQLKTSNNYIEKFEEKIPFALHYPDIPTFILKAKFFEVDFNTAYSMFASRYSGNSNWDKNFKTCWQKFNPNRTISDK